MNRLIVCSVLAAILVVAGSSVPALAASNDGSIFYDDFNDLSQWTIQETDCAPGISASGGVMRFDSTTGSYGYLNVATTNALNYAGATEWATELRFRVVAGDPLSYYEPGNNVWREAGLLVGLQSKPYGTTVDYGLLLDHDYSSTYFTLNWGKYNDTQPEALAPDLLRGQWYTVAMHHKSDNTVDVFLDGALIGSKAAISKNGSTQASYINLVEGSGFVTSIMDYDYISVGAPVPEPSSLLALACGAVGFIGTLARRRRA